MTLIVMKTLERVYKNYYFIIREVIDMCKAWEEQKNEGRELGREEGREEGRIRQAKITALKLQKKGHSIEDIAECVDFDEETVKKWLVS